MNNNRDKRILIFDLETDNLLANVTKVHCIAWRPVSGLTKVWNPHDGGDISEVLEEFRAADLLVGHNILGFDLEILKKFYGFIVPLDKVFDTQVVAELIYPEIMSYDCGLFKSKLPRDLWGHHSLEAWGMRLGAFKGDFHKTTDWSEWSQELQDYCIQDLDPTEALFNNLQGKQPSKLAVSLEHQFKAIMVQQELRGFGFDTKKAEELIAKLQARRAELADELRSVFGPTRITQKTPAYYEAGGKQFATKGAAKKAGFKDAKPGPPKVKEIPFNPASRDQIAQRLISRYGWKPTKFTDGGKPAVDESVVAKMAYPEAKPLAEYLLVNKRLGQIAEGKEAWLNHVRDGRIHGRIKTNGCVTGRCSHSSPNLAQVPASYSPYGSECRALFGPTRKGWRLVGWDADGLELRCLAHFMARYDDGAYVKTVVEGRKEDKTDAHSINAALIEESRDTAKTFIYALIYGAGDEKLGSIVGKGKARGAAMRKKLMSGLPALAKLKSAVEEAVSERNYLLGLDKRVLPIRSKHAALNTLLQSAGAVLMKKAAIIQFEKLSEQGTFGEDWCNVANIHDEIQCEAKPEFAEKVGKAGVEAIKEAGEFFSFRCPLAGEYKIGNNWSETH